ncbi:unnamed protein product [Trichogramma brassicae]|uniref:Uncharacterized protein n=1 Tax=Trichogramma brassicae TaxID=86971 RepID=A0A6H5I5D8_9HYME|nr:unnamed protein product [Trichogramma brassicae]
MRGPRVYAGYEKDYIERTTVYRRNIVCIQTRKRDSYARARAREKEIRASSLGSGQQQKTVLCSWHGSQSQRAAQTDAVHALILPKSRSLGRTLGFHGALSCYRSLHVFRIGNIRIAPFLSSNSTAFFQPESIAKCSGVQPFSPRASTRNGRCFSSPISKNSSTKSSSKFFRLQTMCSEVFPVALAKLEPAPFLSSDSTASSLPSVRAKCNGREAEREKLLTAKFVVKKNKNLLGTVCRLPRAAQSVVAAAAGVIESVHLLTIARQVRLRLDKTSNDDTSYVYKIMFTFRWYTEFVSKLPGDLSTSVSLENRAERATVCTVSILWARGNFNAALT